MLRTIEENLIASLKERATFVGRITTAGRREFYYYGDDTRHCEDTISRTMLKHAAYRIDLGSQRDESWSQYLDLLYPSPEAFQRIKNRRVVEVLERRGDQLAKARPVSHFAYFATPGARNAFIAEVTERGFTIADGSTDGNERSPHAYGVTFEKVDSIDQIDDVTIELFRLARSHDGEYDGWESPVEKET